MGSISKRMWIKFASDEKPRERTSTLVLTSPRSRYVDVRVLMKEPEGSDCPTMRQHPGYPPLLGGVKYLDWAFWGQATVTELEWDDVPSVMRRMRLEVDSIGLDVPIKKEEQESKQVQKTRGKVRTCCWSHLIDSRVLIHNASEADDQGIMFPTDVEGEELERGIMINPATYLAEEYTELWRDVEIKHPH